MKKFAIWSAAILTAFMAYVMIAHELDGLSLAERLTLAIQRFDWAGAGSATGYAIATTGKAVIMWMMPVIMWVLDKF